MRALSRNWVRDLTNVSLDIINADFLIPDNSPPPKQSKTGNLF